jgi:hypothetical protein
LYRNRRLWQQTLEALNIRPVLFPVCLFASDEILQRKIGNLHAFDDNRLCISDGLGIGYRPSCADFDFIGDFHDNGFSDILGLEFPCGAVGKMERPSITRRNFRLSLRSGYRRPRSGFAESRNGPSTDDTV